MTGYFATPIYVTYDSDSGQYEAVRRGTEEPIGVGDDQDEAIECLLRAEREAAVLGHAEATATRLNF